jgi:hypothetical protein
VELGWRRISARKAKTGQPTREIDGGCVGVAQVGRQLGPTMTLGTPWGGLGEGKEGRR